MNDFCNLSFFCLSWAVKNAYDNLEIEISHKGGIIMRNARRCGCSFSQNNTSCMGERIRVNSGCSCRNNFDDQRSGCCENSCRPKPCSRPCPSPCPKPNPCPRPCPKPCPSCEDRCAAQYRNCMRNCRWEKEEEDCCKCNCKHHDDCYDDRDDKKDCED